MCVQDDAVKMGRVGPESWFLCSNDLKFGIMGIFRLTWNKKRTSFAVLIETLKVFGQFEIGNLYCIVFIYNI